MTYWENLAKTYNANLISENEIITANTTPIQKGVKELNWSSFYGDVRLKYFHHEHSMSHNNSTYSQLDLKLNSRVNVEFKLTKIDFLERIYTKIWSRKKVKSIGNYLLKSNNFLKAQEILDIKNIEELSIESIKLTTINEEPILLLTTRENFIREENTEQYIEFILKIAKQISLHSTY